MSKIEKCLVTGCSGFLGQEMCRALLNEGYDVYGIDICDCPIKEVKFQKADLQDRDSLFKLFEGIDTVFHVAAAPYKCSYDLIWRVNVGGTKNVIDACIKNNVSRLIHTSSCSVVFQGNEVVDGTEDMPYTKKSFWYSDVYGQSKAEAERLVLISNGQNGLKTVAIRPHNIYGPGDRLFMPQVAAKAKMLVFGMGNGKNLFSTTHSTNCVHGHILAAKSLEKKPDVVCGQAYNINDGEVGNFWDRTFQIGSEIAEIPKEKFGKIWIPKPVGLTIAWIGEIISKITGRESNINWTAMVLMTTTRTYSIKKAEKDLGYKPVITADEGFKTAIQEAKKQVANTPKKPARKLPILSYWLLFVSSLSLFGTILAFFTPTTIRERQFSTAPDEVTPLAARLFGSWTLLATVLRMTCAITPYNTAVFRLTKFSFVLALGVYMNEAFVHRTSLIFFEAIMPFVVASTSLAWMTFFPPKKEKQE